MSGIVKIENKEIKIVENYIYLGQSISLQQPSQELEINRRVQLGWAVFGKLRYIMKSNLPLCLKKKSLQSVYLATYDIRYGNMDSKQKYRA